MRNLKEFLLFKNINWNKYHHNIYSLECPGTQSGTAAAAAKSLQSCPTLCNPTDGSPPGSPVPGILQARTLEWVAISFSNAWKGKVKVKSLSRVWLLVTPWTAAYQAPLSMGFSRQEDWSGVPLPSLLEQLGILQLPARKWSPSPTIMSFIDGDTRLDPEKWKDLPKS